MPNILAALSVAESKVIDTDDPSLDSDADSSIGGGGGASVDKTPTERLNAL